MKQKIINWGIVGAGSIARKFAEDLKSVSDSNLYAIGSRSIDKAEKFASDFNADLAYGTYETLAQDKKIDAVYIATPHVFHKENTILFLNKGIAVLCEKPFAMNAEEVEDMINCAKQNNTLLMEALWTSFLPHYQYIQELIHKKHFGNVLKLKADFGFVPQYDENSRLFKKDLGGGSLLDIGIYPIFAALSTLGLPNSINAIADFFPNGADSKCDMVFEYNNVTAHLKCTLLEETKTEAVFECENGTIVINGRFHQPTTVTLIDSNGNTEVEDFNYKTLGYNYEIEHFNQLIRNGKTESDIMTFEFSKQLIKLLDAVRAEIGLKY